ncbi:MAG: hypothetical protein KC519_19030 [Anaerolineae bacterium]|nr:hypothetical protein [Anaerolineae bacterium]
MNDMTTHSDLYCPPRTWLKENICDSIILTFRYNLRVRDRLVEVSLRYRVERCTEDYVLSDLLHSLTLLPGEEVLLSTRSRHSVARFVEDASFSAAQVSRTSDRVWMETYKSLATDIDERVGGFTATTSHSHYETRSQTVDDVNLLSLSASSDSTAKGVFDATSSTDFLRQLDSHLESSFHQTNEITRDTLSINLAQVNSHREATAEQTEEVQISVRRFRNINECHTVTHYFYQIAKRQRVKITFLGRTLRALSPFVNAAVRGKASEMSLASNARLNLTQADKAAATGTGDRVTTSRLAAGQQLTPDQENLEQINNVSASTLAADEKARKAALEEATKILDAMPNATLSFEQVHIVPTDAMYVESELGSCMLCEPNVVAKHDLELERLRLENAKLQREVELMENYKDYRCCGQEPDGDV